MISDMMMPDMAKPNTIDDVRQYDVLIIDGGGCLVSAWAAQRDDPDPTSRISSTVRAFVSVVASHCINLLKNGGELVIAWDGRDNRAYRRGRHPWYKHGRGTMIDREEVFMAMDIAAGILKHAGVTTAQLDGHEADDVAATLAKRAKTDGKYVVIASDDKDYYQLVSETVHVVRRSGGGILLTPSVAVMNGIEIGDRYLEIKALAGDNGDNVKPLAGIGEVKATSLVNAIPNFSRRIAAGDLEVTDLMSLDEKILRPFIKAGRQRCFPAESPSHEAPIDDRDCLIEVIEAARWSYDLVRMVDDLDVSPLSFEPNRKALELALRKSGSWQARGAVETILNYCHPAE